MGCFTGYVDGIHDGELIGWVLDHQDPETPAVVTVSIDGLPLTRTLACEHRADVAQALGTSGLHGFRIPLLAASPGEEAELSVTCGDGFQLGTARAPRNVGGLPPLREPRTGPCLLFMHIQKTAGTAFRHAILENYPVFETALVYPGPPGIPSEQFHLMPEEQRRNLRCVIGHFKFGIHESLGYPYEYATILRDPVQRVISNYRHLCYNQSPSVVSPDGQVTSLETLLETGAAVELDNLITRFFRGTDGTDLGTFVTQEWYERALAHLPQFRFIGHQERSDEAWAGLSQRYGWKTGTLKKTNVLSESAAEVSARTQSAIAAYNRFDMMLYRKITSA